jgi:hypothetical protein
MRIFFAPVVPLFGKKNKQKEIARGGDLFE